LLCVGFVLLNTMRFNADGITYRNINEEFMIVQYDNGTEGSVHADDMVWSDHALNYHDTLYVVGLLLTLIPAGLMSLRFSPVRIIAGSTTLACILHILISLLISGRFPGSGTTPFLILKFLEGSLVGFVHPAAHGMLGYWAPSFERTKLVCVVLTGKAVGHFLGIYLAMSMKHQWVLLAVINGVLGVIWSCVWLWLAYDRPSKHPRISRQELLLINESIGDNPEDVPEIRKIPFKTLLRSGPFLAIVGAHLCYGWSFYIPVTDHGREVSYILIILYAMAFSGVAPIAGSIADCLIRRGKSVTVIRKSFTCGGFAALVLCFVTFPIASHSPISAVGIVIMILVPGICACGFYVNHLDLAPHYAGLLFAISSTAGYLALLLDRFIFRKVDDYGRDIDTNMHFVSAVVYGVGIAIYGFFASGERQDWASWSQ